jgi:hypothetical protein
VIDIRTTNVAMLEVSRGVGPQVRLGGEVHDMETAAGGSLPTVLFVSRGSNWELMDYVPSLGELRRNYAVKRPGLQGPIDDAFTGPFLCVRGTGEAWSPALASWANWSLDRFAHEWDKYLRGKLPIKNDTEVTEQDIENHNIILFGDPGSNRLLADILPRLPVDWSRESICLGKATLSTQDHAPVLIYPNPKNARRYVVINSGHTFHGKEFRASNAQLYPRLGDFAVLQFASSSDYGFEEKPVKAGIFNEQWKMP